MDPGCLGTQVDWKSGLVLPIKAMWSGTSFQYNKYSKSHREFNLDQFLKNHAIKYEVSK